MHWRYRIDEDYSYDTGVDVDLDTERNYCDNGNLWMIVDPSGTVTVKKGYAWDGCSPTVNVFDLGYLGTPDGASDAESGLPKTYHASLVHDALCQFLGPDLPFTRAKADEIFLTLMAERRFWPRAVYYWATRVFGGVARALLTIRRFFKLSF